MTKSALSQLAKSVVDVTELINFTSTTHILYQMKRRVVCYYFLNGIKPQAGHLLNKSSSEVESYNGVWIVDSHTIVTLTAEDDLFGKWPACGLITRHRHASSGTYPFGHALFQYSFYIWRLIWFSSIPILMFYILNECDSVLFQYSCFIQTDLIQFSSNTDVLYCGQTSVSTKVLNWYI